MSPHLDILKVMACVTVIGLTAAPVYAQQTMPQQPCTQANAANCVQAIPGAVRTNNPGSGSPYATDPYAPSRNVTPNNPTQQNSSSQQDNSSQQK